MKTTLGQSNSSKELSTEEYKRKFDLDTYGYTDEEIERLCEFLSKLAKIYHEFYAMTVQSKAKVISISTQVYDKEKSHSIRPCEYRRAS